MIQSAVIQHAVIQYASRILSAAILSLMLATPAIAQNPSSQGSLKLVDFPGGGQYVYGDLTGKGTMPDAIVYMLRQVHGHFGDKPAPGKFFQSRDGKMVSSFFTVTAKNQGSKPMAGLLLVSLAPDGSASAAVLYDDASRFTATEPGMMKALSGVWEPLHGGASTSASTSTSTGRPSQMATPQLMRASGGDNSAAISLPPGWHVTGVSGGQLTAVGDHDEMVSMGLIWGNIQDPNNSIVRQQMQLPALAKGPHVFATLGGDMFQTYTSVMNQNRRNDRKPPATFKLISQRPLPGSPMGIQATYLMDLQDGKGQRKMVAQIGVLGTRGAANWAMTVTGWGAPVAIADSEQSLLWAVINTYSQNGQVISQEHQGDMTRIQGDAARANAQTDAINQRREASTASFNAQMKATDARNAAFDQHMDNIDRQSKSFQDYVLDRSVVRDNEYSERATVSNAYADSLVRANPDRFQIVANQNLIKGLDY